ncbi:hypothetical protein [Streptomyces sp. NPDC047981]|uniref:hypothetical protein n=1 Tax=Streptomyces sp. NPDC047981 TaxID=3154610 RepID=UPI0034373EDE
MTVRPSGLPRLQRQTLRHLDDPASPLRSRTGPEKADGLDGLATALRAGELFWVQEDMTALAMHAGESLAAARWATADRPAPCGLLFWQGGIGTMDYKGVSIPVEACAWAPFQGGMILWLLMSRDRLAAEVARVYTVPPEHVPPLIPICGAVLPVTTEPVSFAELDLDIGLPEPIVAALATAWLLMQQPLLIDSTRERADKPTARAFARDGLPTPDVSVVDLRRQYTPQDADPHGDGGSRHYRYRWVVSGHWRNQAYGPDRSLRRRTWVPAHMKGPDGAPLLSTQKVNVWRR